MENGTIFTEKEYSEAYEFCQKNNYTIKEIESSEGRKFQICEKKTNETNWENEINELKNWFDEEYSKQEQKFRRLRTLNILCDDGAEPYDALIKLYNDAEVKRKRIQELELLIAEAKELEKQNQIKGEMIDA